MIINFIAVISWYPLSNFIIKKNDTGELVLDAAPLLGPADPDCNIFGDRIELFVDQDIFHHKHELENRNSQPAVAVVQSWAANVIGARVALVFLIEALLPFVVGAIDARFEVWVHAPLSTRTCVRDFCTAVPSFAEIFVA